MGMSLARGTTPESIPLWFEIPSPGLGPGSPTLCPAASGHGAHSSPSTHLCLQEEEQSKEWACSHLCEKPGSSTQEPGAPEDVKGPHWVFIDAETCAASFTGGAEIRLQDVDPGVTTPEIRVLEMNLEGAQTQSLTRSLCARRSLPSASHQPLCPGRVPAEGQLHPRVLAWKRQWAGRLELVREPGKPAWGGGAQEAGGMWTHLGAYPSFKVLSPELWNQTVMTVLDPEADGKPPWSARWVFAAALMRPRPPPGACPLRSTTWVLESGSGPEDWRVLENVRP